MISISGIFFTEFAFFSVKKLEDKKLNKWFGSRFTEKMMLEA